MQYNKRNHRGNFKLRKIFRKNCRRKLKLVEKDAADCYAYIRNGRRERPCHSETNCRPCAVPTA